MTNDELKATIHELCNTKPHTRNMLVEITRSKDTRIEAALDALSSKRLVFKCLHKGKQFFSTRKVFEATWPSLPLPADDPAKLPALVRIPGPGDGWLHDTKVTYVDGCKITKVAAPADRWAAGLKKGRGAISQDWIARRQGVELPTRFGGAY